MSIAATRMIRWTLRQVMSDRQMTNRRLGELVGLHETSVSNLKRRNDMPRIDGDLLNKLCLHLDCIPSDLIVYVIDEKTHEYTKNNGRNQRTSDSSH